MRIGFRSNTRKTVKRYTLEELHTFAWLNDLAHEPPRRYVMMFGQPVYENGAGMPWDAMAGSLREILAGLRSLGLDAENLDYVFDAFANLFGIGLAQGNEYGRLESEGGK